LSKGVGLRLRWRGWRFLIPIVLVSFVIACSEDRRDPAPDSVATMILERGYEEVFPFEILPATGPGTIRERGNTADLLMHVPYLFTSGLIPPETILNELLSRGLADAGMSGGAQWEPYTLKPGGFDRLVQELVKAYTYGSLEYQEPDAWVRNFEDWHVWVMYVKHGVPWEEHKRLNDAVVAIEKAMKIAKENNDEARVNELHLKNIKAGTELSDYVMWYLSK